MPTRQSLRNKAATVTQTAGAAEKTVGAIQAVNGRAKVEAVVTTTEEVQRTGKRKAVESEEIQGHRCGSEGEQEEEEQKQAAKAPTKRQKTGNAMPLAARTAVSALRKAMYIGAHVSAAGGIHNSIQNSLQIGGNAFALFLKNQRTWKMPPLEDEMRDQFRALCKEHGYDAARHCLPHGSYLVNLAQSDQDKADLAYGNFVDDLRRCDALGIRLYNFHPGSTLGGPRDEAIARIAACLNRSHRETEAVVTVIENMAGGGNVVGSRFEDLRDLIALVDDKDRVGVCIDTCHTFAAGYDLRAPDAFAKTMAEFDSVVGLRYLRALHLNDSKAPLGCNRDLHGNIGTGFLGLRAFHNVVNYAPFQGLPMVLETPIDRKRPDGKTFEDRQVWADEIKLLESLIGMDPESDEFKTKEEELQRQGASEMKRIQGQTDKKADKEARREARKAAKEAKKAQSKKTPAKKGPAKKKRGKKADSDDEDWSD